MRSDSNEKPPLDFIPRLQVITCIPQATWITDISFLKNWKNRPYVWKCSFINISLFCLVALEVHIIRWNCLNFLSIVHFVSLVNNRELRQASDVFVNTTSDWRGGTGLKTVFVSGCGNLQHIGQNIRFLQFCTSLYERYDAKYSQN